MSSDYYLEYLIAIDEGAHEVSDWEARFIEDMLKHRPARLTEKQQDVIRRMAERYLGEQVD